MAVDSSHSNAEPEAVSFAAPRGRFIPFGIPFGSATYGESLLASPPTHRHDLFNCEELVPSRVCARTLRLTAVSHRAQTESCVKLQKSTTECPSGTTAAWQCFVW